MTGKPKITRFKESVLSKFQIYNSIFLTLPFDRINKTGVLLPLFHETCLKGFKNGNDPSKIVEDFFIKYQARRSKKSQINLLFRFIQYIERQVVLFDAIEDAAFPVVNNMDGVGTIRNLKESAITDDKIQELKKYIEDFNVKIVLTAHPTQFYPDNVLAIITDLTDAIKNNKLMDIRNYLTQLAKTSFFKSQKPTPYNEAVSLIWYLENVFYHSFGNTYNYIQENIFNNKDFNNNLMSIGFWPGGDRDGNPFVTPEITLQVAQRLKHTIVKNYYRDIRELKRRLTFKGLEDKLTLIQQKLHHDIFINSDNHNFSSEKLIEDLSEIKELIIKEHQSLYLNLVVSLINKVKLFGSYFASMDIRQDSRVHNNVFNELVKSSIENKLDFFPENYFDFSEAEQIQVLSNINGNISLSYFSNELVLNTLNTIKVIKKIQTNNGEKAANRYIISNNKTALNVMQLYAMLKLVAFNENLSVDICPLFETIEDLENASDVMEVLYKNSAYSAHLKHRKLKQHIMLGFSDGTKDGGYLMANWAIYKAKQRLTSISRKFKIDVIFFDGRGGPPARGGGKTHKFYASLGPSIESKEVQLTIQGQTISSNFGTLDSSKYNIEQLMSSGILNKLNETDLTISDDCYETMDNLSKISYDAYVKFKSHPKFLSYLEHMSTLKYYSKTNVGSRPSKRNSDDKLVFSDLRAIPFVGSWSQLKQNVPGFFGVGHAIKHYDDLGQLNKVKKLYKESSFFKTLIENSMMSLSKSFLDLTKYMSDDKEYGDFWNIIYDEYNNTLEMLYKLTGSKKLMKEEPAGKLSIEARESIVLPLLTIQQHALKKLQELKKDPIKNSDEIIIYDKIVTRSLFGNINASRNSA
ncbi:MAG: phosphoenolpyruvate carboxylase [Flavobacteriaceae bacterium TMED238]|nr:phosphoenolpyruvate carboxylase [Flavobacteriaceae bacterium]RPG63732.1 MAG: phosphoenolpyruvate carboxylase [Flavobacteriaceae bacterium TMED238]